MSAVPKKGSLDLESCSCARHLENALSALSLILTRTLGLNCYYLPNDG